MQLYLVRHGQSINNALPDQSQRVKDPELTETGCEQARLTAAHLLELPGELRLPAAPGISELYCSPMHRALQTAQPVAEALGLRPRVWVELHEIGGIFLNGENGVIGHPGMGRGQMAQSFPQYELPPTVTDEGWWNPADGMETEQAAQFRALKVAAALYERAPEEINIVLVTHGAFMDRLLKALLNQLPDVPRRLFYAHYNTGITRLDLHSPDGIRLHYLNRADHIPPPLRTW